MAELPSTKEQVLNFLFSTHDPREVDRKAAVLKRIRKRSDDLSAFADKALLDRISAQHAGLREAYENLNQARELLDRFSEPPWYPAVHLRRIEGEEGGRAMIWCNHQRRVVTIGPDVDPDGLHRGREVLVNKDLSVILALSDNRDSRSGPLAVFDRRTEDGRLVLIDRNDEELLAEAAFELADTELEQGDRVRWDRACGLALEKIPRRSDVPPRHSFEQVTEASVGGCRQELDELLGALTITLTDPEKARAYGLEGRRTILMTGPPGCGKTLMARVAASEISRRGGAECHFRVVKPAEWYDPFVGVSERNIRETFADLAKAAEKGPAVLFLDEIDSVGRSRGGLVGYHSDRFLTALLAEIDGFQDLPGVAIVCATNRKDLLDAALLERIGDIEIQVARPNQDAARAIFDIHLPRDAPFRLNGDGSKEVREVVIDTAVSRLYAPNGGNELCRLHFRDATQRVVAAREMASGRLFRQICRRAAQRAFYRDVFQREPGIGVEDMEKAVEEAFERLATTLTPRNAHNHLSDLPEDLDVVRVEPIGRRVGSEHRYVNIP